MIQPQELRIGNFIYDDENKIVKVEKIESQYFNQENEPGAHLVIFSKHGHGLWESDIINPIPLTEEILLKCGFVESSKPEFKLMLKICGIKLYCRFNTEWYFELEGIYLGSKPKYLHELQNLYFSLLGTELNIKGL